MAVPAVSASPRTLPLLWCGALRDPSGYADEARAFLRALDVGGYGVAAHELRWTTSDAGLTAAQNASVERALRMPRPVGGVVVVHGVAHPQQSVNAEGPTVERTMFETDSIPQQFRMRCVDV